MYTRDTLFTYTTKWKCWKELLFLINITRVWKKSTMFYYILCVQQSVSCQIWKVCNFLVFLQTWDSLEVLSLQDHMEREIKVWECKVLEKSKQTSLFLKKAWLVSPCMDEAMDAKHESPVTSFWLPWLHQLKLSAICM